MLNRRSTSDLLVLRARGAVIGLSVLLAASLTAAGCTSSAATPGGEDPTPKATVVIENGAYSPRRVDVPVGARVTWVNRNVHPVTVETAGVAFFEYDRDKLDRQNRFDLHTIDVGEAESVLFDTPGRYDYHSSFHASMRGTVVVRPRPTRD